MLALWQKLNICINDLQNFSSNWLLFGDPWPSIAPHPKVEMLEPPLAGCDLSVGLLFVHLFVCFFQFHAHSSTTVHFRAVVISEP